MTDRSWLRIVVPLALLAAAGVARFVLLGDPDVIVFDETYYVSDARSHLEHGAEEGFAVHPPVGKWLIAAGFALFGDTPFGWRAAAAAAGTVLVLVTYLAGRRLLPDLGAAALAALLAATDGLLLVQSRIAMLDVFLALFVALGAWLLLVDRDVSGVHGAVPPTGGVEPPPPPRSAGGLPHRVHPYRLLAGAAFGLAVATKWSGVLALGAALLVVLGWELAWRRRLTGRMWAAPTRLALTTVAGIVVVPAVVYAVSWVPWLAGYAHTHEGAAECAVEGDVLEPCPVAVTARIGGLARHHVAMWRFHRDLEADHPYTSHASTWPLMTRPIVYHWESCPPDEEACAVAEGNAVEIVALGNPVLWWGALLALVPLLVGIVRRDGRAAFVATFWAGQYVPWLVVDRPLFLFYMTPVVAFMALGLAYATGRLDERWPRRGRLTPGRVVASLLAVAAVALFAYFLPVWIGLELDEALIRQRWWLEGWI